jgi:hypothetical protein
LFAKKQAAESAEATPQSATSEQTVDAEFTEVDKEEKK